MYSVLQLQDVIRSRCQIPQDKQVLLISGGENLDPAARVCSYSAGTVCRPILLPSLVQIFIFWFSSLAFSALMLLVGWQEGHPAWWGAGMVICLERGADLHMVQLMPLPLAVSCFIKIQIGFIFLVLAHPCSPGQRAVKWVRVCCVVHWLMRCVKILTLSLLRVCQSLVAKTGHEV